MYQFIVLFIALRYIRGKTISVFNQYIRWISSVSVMLGTMILIIISSVMNGFEYHLKRNLFYFMPHALLTHVQGYVRSEYIPKSMLYGLHGNLIHTEPLVISDTVILQSAKKITLGVMLGVKSDQYEPLFNCLIKKQFNLLIPDKYYIIIGSALAKILEVSINDQIRLVIPSIIQATPIGYIPSQRLFTILDIYVTNSEVDNYQVLVNQVDAAKLMHYPLQCVTGWRLWLRDPFKLQNQLKLSPGWKYKNWGEYKTSLFQAIKMEKNVMFLLLSLIIIASGFNVVSFLVLLMMDKQKEIAILRTYGLNRFQIVSLFMIQGIWNGFLGIALGTGFGLLLTYKLNQILSFFNCFTQIPVFPTDIQYSQILMIILVTFVLIFFVTLYSSLRATSVNIVKML